MNIYVVGNVLKDVYLNLDSRKCQFEIDKNNTKWLNLSFDASSNYFFNRNSSLGGAAVSLEVFEKMGIPAKISGSNLRLENGELTENGPAEIYRYILVSDGNVSYLVPNKSKTTNFTPPAEAVDCLYIDRSAHLDKEAIKRILTYLELSQKTKLVVYLKKLEAFNLKPLLNRADLLIYESHMPELDNLPPEKLIKISEAELKYLNITERIAPNRIDVLTHLSAYSIASATIIGGFILGRSVEESLKMARANLENARLNSVLNLSELEEITKNLRTDDNLELIAASLVIPKKGILAADESGGSIKKKFENLNIPDSYENRRDYRNLFFTTPDLEKYINGVILFDETARQLADNGQNFVEYLTTKRIIPGIKVDQGLEKFENSEETYTKGLENLAKRLHEYYLMGLRFAKWRAAFEIRLSNFGEILAPTEKAIDENCRILAEYALECQSAGLVPIVEPEVVYDGNYDIEKSAEITGIILDKLFEKLNEFGVNLRACILKVNMVLSGKQSPEQSTSEEVGQKTAEVLKAHVPKTLAGVVFLSGGQTPKQATENLAEIVKNGPFPWPVTFSFARALQDPALYAWSGDNANTEEAKKAFRERLVANSKALDEKE